MSVLTFYSYPKQLDAMIHIYTTSQEFFHLFDPKYSKSSNFVKYFLVFKITAFYLNIF